MTVHKISVPEGDDQDRAYDEHRQREFDAQRFDRPAQAKPKMTKCPKCEHIEAVVICTLCGTERPFYTKLKAALDGGALPVGDHNAAEVLRALKADS